MTKTMIYASPAIVNKKENIKILDNQNSVLLIMRRGFPRIQNIDIFFPLFFLKYLYLILALTNYKPWPFDKLYNPMKICQHKNKVLKGGKNGRS